MLTIKTTPNEINAVIVFEINEENKSFTIEHKYDNQNIKFDSLLDGLHAQNKINELREKGYKGEVKKKNQSN